MAIVYSALIAKEDYDAFRRAVAGMPATFQEWTHRRNQIEADAVSKRWELVEIEVKLEDYIRDCNATKTPHDLHSLDNFAAKIALREHK